MAARVSAEASGPSYASVLNFRGVESNKENIEAPVTADEVVDPPPKQQEPDEEEEGFVPVISHGRSKGKGRRDRDRRGGPSRPHKVPAQHPDASAQTAEQQQSSDAQSKKFVEAPIPKVNPWQVSSLNVSNPIVILIYLQILIYFCNLNNLIPNSRLHS